MSNSQPTIFLVLYSNNKQKRIEITEKPKKVSVLPVLVQNYFNVFSTSLLYSIHFNNEKIELNDSDEMQTKYYEQSDTIEIHIITNEEKKSVMESWMMLSNMPMFQSISKPSLHNKNSVTSNPVSGHADIDVDKENIEIELNQKIVEQDEKNHYLKGELDIYQEKTKKLELLIDNITKEKDEMKANQENESEEKKNSYMDHLADINKNWSGRETRLKKNCQKKIDEYKRNNNLLETKQGTFRQLYSKSQDDKSKLITSDLFYTSVVDYGSIRASNISTDCETLKVVDEKSNDSGSNWSSSTHSIKTNTKEIQAEFSVKESNLNAQISKLTREKDDVTKAYEITRERCQSLEVSEEKLIMILSKKTSLTKTGEIESEQSQQDISFLLAESQRKEKMKFVIKTLADKHARYVIQAYNALKETQKLSTLRQKLASLNEKLVATAVEFGEKMTIIQSSYYAKESNLKQQIQTLKHEKNQNAQLKHIAPNIANSKSEATDIKKNELVKKCMDLTKKLQDKEQENKILESQLFGKDMEIEQLNDYKLRTTRGV